MLAAGDIAACGHDGDEQTARILARYRGTILTLGDNVYDSGTTEEFTRCYAPSWGRFRQRTRPSVGNHDYRTPGASGFLHYFRLRRTYYAFDLGRWRLYALDSEEVSPAQLAWLRRDLASHRRRCVLAYWHRPLYSSGPHGNDGDVRPFWVALLRARAELVLSGHDHDYERFAPQDADGRRTRGGIRQLVVGTGGRSHYGLRERQPNSVVFDGETYGVLRLELRPSSYRWRFLPAGGSFTDAGRGSCA